MVTNYNDTYNSCIIVFNRRKVYKVIRLLGDKLLQKAFTLAEVLIVLGIIGVVAEMTIPTLMHNFQEQVFKTSYKRAFSLANQAWSLAVTNDQMLDRPNWGDMTSKVNNFNAFKSNFKVVKDCNSGNHSDCWANGDVVWGGLPSSDALAFIDASGIVWSLLSNSSGNGPEMVIDTNGAKKPNKFGQDRFIFVPESNETDPSLGLPVRILQYPDYTSYDHDHCPSGASHPCYYTTWLMN